VIGGPVPSSLDEAYIQAVAFTAQAKSRSTNLSAGKRTRKPLLPSVGLLLDSALLPPSLGRTWLSKALQTHGSTPLVSFLACNFLYIGLRKAQATSEALKRIGDALPEVDGKAWNSAARRVKDEAKDRIPDLQVLIALVQNGLGRAFTRAGSLASIITAEGGATEDGDPVQEDNTLLISLALRTIQLYHSIVPSAFSSLRFDFGRLLSSSFFSTTKGEAAPLAALGQSALLELLSSPGDAETGEGAIAWQWSKAIEGGRSPLASIINIYLSTEISSLRLTAGRTTTNLLGTSSLFEHNPEEVEAWLAALPREDGEGLQGQYTLAFLDNSIQRCLQAPFRYVDTLHALLSQYCRADCGNASCRSASPLLATLLEQLKYRFSRPESAVPYAGFARRLAIELAGKRSCLCISRALVEQAGLDAKEASSQKEAMRELRMALAYIDFLNGKALAVEGATSLSDAEAFIASLNSADGTSVPRDVSRPTTYLQLTLHRIRAKPTEASSLVSVLDSLLDAVPSALLQAAKRLVFGGDALLSITRDVVQKGATAQSGTQVICRVLCKHLSGIDDEELFRPFARLLVDSLPANVSPAGTSILDTAMC
jgi:hypothetical protein